MVTRAVEKLSIEWPDEKTQNNKKTSKVYKPFLISGQGHLTRKHLPFFPDLHTEVLRSWNNPYTTRTHTTSTSNYSTIVGFGEYGYAIMPWVEETLAGYLSLAAFRWYAVSGSQTFNPLISGQSQKNVKKFQYLLVWRLLRNISQRILEQSRKDPEFNLTILKRVGDLQASSVASSRLHFAPGLVKVILQPRPGYVPKVPYLAIHPVILQAFSP